MGKDGPHHDGGLQSRQRRHRRGAESQRRQSGGGDSRPGGGDLSAANGAGQKSGFAADPDADAGHGQRLRQRGDQYRLVAVGGGLCGFSTGIQRFHEKLQSVFLAQ